MPDRMTWLTAIVASSWLALAVAPAVAAGDDPATWERFEYRGPREINALLEQQRFGPAYWAAGDHTVPRLYVADIPARWGQARAPSLTVQDKKIAFIYLLGPTVLAANERVAQERRELERLVALRKAGKPLDAAGSQWLQALANRYDVPGAISADATLAELLERVDIVPTSLVLAQAATESGWGTSRFAAQGNALFGQWTYGGDGIRPKEQRTATKGNYRIRAFRSPLDSIGAYIHNLNTQASYAALRRERRVARQTGKPLSGEALAAGLIRYSERGQAYVDELRALIRRNGLWAADTAVLRDMRPILLVAVGEGVD